MGSLLRESIPLLSKSRFMAGLQCHKRLYLECYNRDLADEVSAAQQAIFDTGTNVGQVATGLYPGGVIIAEDHLHHEKALQSTREAIDISSVPAIYEAAFIFDDVRIRADILARIGDAFDLIEVKSGTSTRKEHLFDVAVQLYVLKGAGIKVRRACLCHINNEYVYRGGEYELEKLFAIDDITGEAHQLQPTVISELEEMREPLWKSEPPKIKAGRQCSNPYICPFYGHCHADEPEHHISELYKVSPQLLQELEDDGIAEIQNIPEGFTGMNPIQQRMRDCVAGNHLYIDPELPEALGKLEYPIHFLDFETFNPALPLFVGTRPYQVIPFQWSDHILERDGMLHHREYLHDGPEDPREPFARSLLETLGTKGSIVVYSAFEASRIRDLAAHLPHLAGDLLALNDRIVDLLILIRNHCYHPEFHGSFSIKSVLPALVPDLGYDDLEINEGRLASVAYAEMTRPETLPERREFIRNSLLKYCERDTEAEVRLVEMLRGSG